MLSIFNDLSSLSNTVKQIQTGIQFLYTLPTPEESLVKSKDQIAELESVIQKINTKIEELSHDNTEDAIDSVAYLKEQLESYTMELDYIKEQNHMLSAIVTEDDDEFLENIPTFYKTMKKSVDEKIEDVNTVVEIIKKKRELENCMKCEKKIRDEKGRKSSVKHYHVKNINTIYENDDYIYTPVICDSCLNSIMNNTVETSTVFKNCSKGEVDYGFVIEDNDLQEIYNSYAHKIESIDKEKEIKKLLENEEKPIKEKPMTDEENIDFFTQMFKMFKSLDEKDICSEDSISDDNDYLEEFKSECKIEEI